MVTLRNFDESTFNSATGTGGFLFATDNATVVMDGTKSTSTDISFGLAGESGGLLAPSNGAAVDNLNFRVQCGNQAENGGDNFFFSDDATVESHFRC